MAGCLHSQSGRQPELTAFIGLGSNLGDGPRNLLAAWSMLTGRDRIRGLALSSPWRSSPVEMESPQWFTNAVGEIATSLSPERLLDTLLAVEYAMGRCRRQGRDRIIDLDVLAYGDRKIVTPTLTVPHPEMHRRLFVLAPMAEIAPGFFHPVLRRSASELFVVLQGAAKDQQIQKERWPAEAAA